jgi:hypothetical protein
MHLCILMYEYVYIHAFLGERFRSACRFMPRSYTLASINMIFFFVNIYSDLHDPYAYYLSNPFRTTGSNLLLSFIGTG